MTKYNQNNSRIAKNTLLLYARMLLLLFVSLYTSRVTLEALGVEDFGIYNVVGGVVTMFSIISSSLTSAIQRFLSYELGKCNYKKLQSVFSTAVNIQICMAILVFLLSEIFGLWFLNNRMNISPERLSSANWVFQCSIISFMIGLISIPYNAAIIANERMSAFALISVLEAMLRLMIVAILYTIACDRLIVYAILISLLSILLRIIYGIYCRRNFVECRYQFILDKSLLKKMGSFAGWNFIGSSSAILRNQGVNIALNIFCGASVNAARGIANQVNHAVHTFVANFMTAIRPQITKSYAIGDIRYLMDLLYVGSRIAYFMILFLAMPIIIDTKSVLNLWLTVIPDHTVSFVRLILIFVLFESISEPLITAQQATGRIKWYQITVGGLQSLNFPLSLMWLWLGGSPETAYYTAIFLGHCCLFARLYMLKRNIGLKPLVFIKKVYFRMIFIMLASSIFPYLLTYCMEEGILRLATVTFMSWTGTVALMAQIGCNKQERAFVLKKTRQIVRKIVYTND